MDKFFIPDKNFQHFFGGRLSSNDSGGYGLKNVDERIRLTYGEEYGLNIQSIEGESTLVTFCIPVDGEKKGAEGKDGEKTDRRTEGEERV